MMPPPTTAPPLTVADCRAQAERLADALDHAARDVREISRLTYRSPAAYALALSGIWRLHLRSAEQAVRELRARAHVPEPEQEDRSIPRRD